ncbi:HIT family protein [Alkalicoccus urumqiensis]|uniref:HIT family protein n=1 Tax=Alkalicoccus urumqiensis TaxID=1548213 RepID=A0A2P6MJM9_ALKUR|nr:HIT family protein [Alkalicoccus urumqiensis]PRO66475.1 HIT family protein [Alkalicoccus urumqiensis]
MCAFCELTSWEIDNELAFAIYDKYPVSDGHVLIIPKRHTADYFDLTKEEQEAMHALMGDMRERLLTEREPDGFNVGINCGAAAGQTIFHVHMHLIPRYSGDMTHPEGGVRGVIPEKQKY